MIENFIHTDAGRHLVRQFEETIPYLIKEGAIWPLPMMLLTDSKGVEFVHCDMPDHKAMDVFANAVKHPGVQAAILGIDRFGDPEMMQTEMHDVLSCVVYEKGSPLLASIRVREQFRFGIIEYHDQPRAVRKMNWSNRFWINEMRSELYRVVPDVILGQEGSVMFGPDMQRVIH
jgi:hypothetical protein